MLARKIAFFLFPILLLSCALFRGERKQVIEEIPTEKLPLKVAVLPFDNKTDHEEAAQKIRGIFYQHFSGKSYVDVELSAVDAALQREGLDTIKKIKKKSPEELAKILDVDGVICGTVTKFSSYVKGAMTKVGAEVELIDTRNGKTIASIGPLTKSLYDIDIPTSPYGAAWTLVKGLMRDAEARKFSAMHALCDELSSAIPEPPIGEVQKPPRLYALVHDFSERETASPLYKKTNEMIQVVAVGDKFCRATFSIEGVSGKIPMKEEPAQGNYSNYKGEYKIKQGDNVTKGHITITLVDSRGNKMQFRDPAGEVNIDSTPPEPPQNLEGMGRDQLSLFSWKPSGDEGVAVFGIYRKGPADEKFKLLSKTPQSSFEDTGVENYQPYVYRITAFDLAGNESSPSEILQLIPKSSPPTVITRDIIKDTLWYKEASPYVLKGKIRILHKATLVIPPGVVVQSSGAALEVFGRLIAKGEEKTPIVFTSSKTESAAPGDWQGIIFSHSGSPQSVVKYCRVQYASKGISCVSSSPVIQNNLVCNNRIGVFCTDFSKPVIDYNLIENNVEAGIRIEKMSDPKIKYNKITYNDRFGVWCDNALSLFSHNEISHNGEYELFYESKKDEFFKAFNNYWGAGDHEAVKEKIFGRVEFISKAAKELKTPKKKAVEKEVEKRADKEEGEEKKVEEKTNEPDPWKKLKEAFE